MNLNIKQVHENAIFPTKAYKYDAGLDLYACESTFIEFGQTCKINTGLIFEIPEGYCGLICDRSSMALKGLQTVGGVIDSQFRGVLSVCLYYGRCKHDEFGTLYDDHYVIEVGHKIAQMLILPVPEVNLVAVSEVSDTDRGSGGFGSSGL